MWLIVKYSFFAALATAANILCQEGANRLYHGPFDLYASMAAGTLAGLVIKYVLDKKYIFSFRNRNLRQDGRQFILYSLMGVATTCLFWVVELGFDHVFQTLPMRYAGGAAGLCMGYFLKYRLDRKFVFVECA